jgi:YD repeat-containing protein
LATNDAQAGIRALVAETVRAEAPCFVLIFANSCPTLTNVPLSNSPAIDTGSPSPLGSGGNACEATDQRRYGRSADGDANGAARCDIGAYEVGAAPVAVIAYAYDPLYRLTAANYSNGLAFNYTYDAVGNRLTQTTITATTVYTYDDANRLVNVGGVNYTWDNNGNLLNDGASTYAYSLSNPINYTDPSGHVPCRNPWTSSGAPSIVCFERGADYDGRVGSRGELSFEHDPNTGLITGVLPSGRPAQAPQWRDDEKRVLEQAALATGRAFAKVLNLALYDDLDCQGLPVNYRYYASKKYDARNAFLAVFGGPI